MKRPGQAEAKYCRAECGNSSLGPFLMGNKGTSCLGAGGGGGGGGAYVVEVRGLVTGPTTIVFVFIYLN